MKRIDALFTLLFVPVDYLLLFAAGFTSYALRYQSFVTQFRPVFFDYPLHDFLPSLALICLVGVCIFALTGSYRIASHYNLGELFTKAFLGVSTTILIIIVAVFLRRELFSSRFVVILAWLIAIIFVFVGRAGLLYLKTLLLKRGIGTHALVIVGTGRVASDLVSYIQNNSQLGYRIIAQLDGFGEETKNKLIELKHNNKLDEILDTRESVHEDQASLIRFVNFAHEHNVMFRYIASLHQTKLAHFDTDSLSGYPIVQINKTPLMGWRRIYKRSTDVALSLFFLIVLSPLMALVAIVVTLDSHGPTLVRLQRVGRGGRIFTLYKFRSMIQNADALKSQMMSLNERSDGPLFKIRHDPRVTRVGAILRRSSLDELPQLWNVLRGDMSLVGPRPHEPEEVNRYNEAYRTILSVKPGISGLSQVSGRSNLLFEDEIKLDTYYIENWSQMLDIWILAKTVFVIFKFSDAA
ncbi:MAG: hypothetical protein A3B30_04140 [Candidatus Komeilibacteria bacterium RIFCSPLOWO2_01_FULL_52_15]|uniref:Bacterial sugar transferase domain-containing protein n=2 Tax=Candidatus Komeiliibacteriota TaxID=1817908 RepID=A0A1G2BQZ0_9BACT|nr:MAG: hypothetical protein A2677_01030 [Candidatus Komeilibacteria bacterium RIFCSPHIGHO2_01_FULL_52_14]OGY91266.1 MAG: hypothetical protein A3B30_04140 [Candidatus Komeilibacteria bacterium RIFCSPLOWO2_01_FULL_52_15]